MSAILKIYAPESSAIGAINPPHHRASKKPVRKSVRWVWRKFLRPEMVKNNRAVSTIKEIELHLSRYESYWRKKRMLYPLLPKRVRPEHLAEWQSALKKQGHSNRTTNKHLGSIKQILSVAERNGLVRYSPGVKALPTKRAAIKYYFRSEQIELLWKNVGTLAWPTAERIGILPSETWRIALMLYVTYGFRTQELLSFESVKQPLTWQNIRWHSETPNPGGTAQNEWGWLWYVPQKQKWAKPDPLYLPLTRHARAAINRLAAVAGVGPETSDTALLAQPLIPIPKSRVNLYSEWDGWCVSSGVLPKQLPGSLPVHFNIKHLRKTCATLLNRHYPGLAEMVCGWGQREGAKDDSRSRVALDHYIADEQVLVEKLNSCPFPKCFDDLLT
jgi:hypothetical protein